MTAVWPIRVPLRRLHGEEIVDFSGSSQIGLQQVSCSLAPIPSDEWLQVALALEYRNSSERPPLPFGNGERLGCLNGSIRGDEASLAAVHLLRIEGLATMGAPHPENWGDARKLRKAPVSPDDAVDEAFRRSRPGEGRKGVFHKKFRYSARSEPADTRRPARR
jgi:hypothetical protein